MSKSYIKALQLSGEFLKDKGWVKGGSRKNDEGYSGLQTCFNKGKSWFWIQDTYDWPARYYNDYVGYTMGWPDDIMIYHTSDKDSLNTKDELQDFLIENGITTRGKLISRF